MNRVSKTAFQLIDLLVVFVMIMGSPMTALAQDTTPLLVTDKTEYSPGEVAHITGSEFPAGDYVLSAEGPDGTLDWGMVTADEAGGFASDSLTLTTAGTYEVHASAAGSATSVASAEFTVTAPPEPTIEPTTEPTVEPTAEPTVEPTVEPTAEPTQEPTPPAIPFIQSDKSDYAPGELVTLTGGNWQGDTQVRIFVNDDVGKSWSRDVIVDVASDGTVVDSFNLPSWFVATYVISAGGQQTGRVVTTTFTDSQEDYKHYGDKAPAGWQNGALQSTNSQYFEGEVVPHYWKTEGLTVNQYYGINIYYDYYDSSSGGYCGFDYLTQYNISRNPPPVGTWPYPIASLPGVSGALYTVGAGNVYTSGPYNAGIQRFIQVRFLATTSKVEFYWGLHLAQPGVISGCQGSKAWPGASLQSDVRATPQFTQYMLGGGGSMQINPGAVIRGTISGSKWNDLDGDGVVDGNESKLSGWPIRLCYDSGCTGVIQTTTTDGSGNYNFNVTPGTYFVREIQQSGWSQTYPGSGYYGPLTISASTPTYTNMNFGNRQGSSITIVKDAVPNDAQDFSFYGSFGNFALDDDSDPLLTNSRTFSNLSPSVYTVGEYVTGYWGFSGITCTGGSTVTYEGQPQVQIYLNAGQNVVCTFTNTKRGTIIVEKQTDPNGAAGSFTFTGTAAGTIADNGQIMVANLPPGSYTSTEADPAPAFNLSSIWCDDTTSAKPSTGDVSTRTATFNLDPGEVVKCTFTNTQQKATLIVKKVLKNNNGGAKGFTDFSFVVNGGTPITFDVDGQNELSVDPGIYSVTESNVAGYSASYENCTDISITAGGTATCTITNDDQPGTLIVKKVVVTDNGGTASAEGFSFSVNGGTEIGFEADGQNDLTVDAGKYTVTEPAVDGYSTTYYKCSDVIIANGGSATCTITNNDNAPSLTLVKTVVTDNGGTAVPTDFTLSASGPTPISGAGGATSDATFSTGMYDLSEAGPVGYTASDWTCVGGTQTDKDTVQVGLGEAVTCTITNDDQSPSLTLVKVVKNDDGGDAVANNWILTATGPTGFLGAGPSASNDASFDAGTYDLSEAGPSGYSAGEWVCVGGTQIDADTITLAVGQSATCTITNDDVAPTLKLVKAVTNDNNGNAVANNWTLSAVAEMPNDERNFSNLGGSGVFETIFANVPYDLSESTLAGYEAGNWQCNGGSLVNSTVTLTEGETNVTCTVTNDDVAPTLTLIKTVKNDNGGNAVVSDFPLFINGTPVTSGIPVTLSANTLYTASETTLDGYTPSAWGGDCASDGTITLNEGENKICTITNDDVAPTITLIKNVVNNNGGNALPDDFHLTIGGTPALSGTAYPLGANTPYAINETQLSGYTFVSITGNPKCPNVLGGTVTLDEGENITCAITNDDIAPTLTLIKNVINDHGGNAKPDDFGLTIGDNAATSGISYPLDANTPYVINETTLLGYSFVDIVGNAECPAVLGGTVTLDEGENVTCTITNDDKPATLIIIKHVVNDNGGPAQAASFTLDSGGVDDSPDDFAGEEAPGTVVTLDAGSYNVSETGPSGYSAIFSANCAGTIANGATKTCIVTNDDIQPQLIVVKHVITDNGGVAVAGNFSMNVNGNNVSPDNFAGSEIGVNVALDAGSYAVSEMGPAGYAASFSTDCTGSIAVGQVKTCTVTNNDISPTLTVIKLLDPADDTGLFDLQIDGNTYATDVGNNGTTGAVAVDAGMIHTVSEMAGTGTSLLEYDTVITGDCDANGQITLALAENKICTITNTKHGTLIVEKQTDPDALVGEFSFTGDVTGTISDGGQIVVSNISAGTYTSKELVPDGWQLTGITCDDTNSSGDVDASTATFHLDPGETMKCTFTNDPLPTISVEKSATPTSIDEPGGDITFTVSVINTSFEPVTVTSLTDNVYGDLLNDAGNNNISNSTCIDNTVIALGAAYTCSFTGTVSGEPAVHTDTVTAIAHDDENNDATNSASAAVTITDVPPSITVSKTANPTSVPETGADVTFTFVVTNTSVEPVTITSLSDSDFGTLSGDADCKVTTVLPVKGSCEFSEVHFISGDFEGGISHNNVFTAYAKDNEGNNATNNDDATVDFTDSVADIAVIKVTVDGATSGDGLNILTGESIKWRYTVSNAGNYPLSNISVIDSISGVTPVYVSGDANNNGKLDLTETWIYEASGTASTDNYSNTGTAYGDLTDGAGNIESDTATDGSAYFGADPQIAVAKITVDGATSGDGLNILAGEPITWRYTVTNLGNVALSNVTVTDNKAGINPVYVSGDINSNNKLDLTETWIFEATGTAAAGNYSNTGTAKGTYTDSAEHSRTDTATDTSSYFGANPQIDIVKKTIGSDGSEGDNVFMLFGASVTWKYYVTNTGNVALTNVSVTDNKIGAITCPKTALAIAESMTCTATGTNNTPIGTWYNNTGTVAGSYTDSAGHAHTATDTDASAYYSQNPGVVTNSSLCDFGTNFTLIFTPDVKYYTSSTQAFKLSDSNPGQFFYNMFRNAGPSTVTLTLPYPFVTQGATPIHVYSNLTAVTVNGQTCLQPTNEIKNYQQIVTLGNNYPANTYNSTTQVTLTGLPTTGFIYINIHMDYGLEKLNGWIKSNGSNANYNLTINPAMPKVNILNNTAHTFTSSIPSSTDTIYNSNSFKSVKGFGGLVLIKTKVVDGVNVFEGLKNAKIELRDSSGRLIETMYTDVNGWYLSKYVPSGKSATFTIKVIGGSGNVEGVTYIYSNQIKSVTTGGSNKFGEGAFTIIP